MTQLTPVREAHRFDQERLAKYLQKHLNPNIQSIDVQQFEGGQSNPTFLIRSVGPTEQRYVLRKQPPGKLLKSAHQVDREYRVMRALRTTAVPVPQMLHLCEDPEIIGTKFYVMDHIEGRVIADPSLPECSESERQAIYKDFVRILAALHAVDFKAIGLADFGREGNYYERQISTWTRQYHASETDPLPDMDFLIDWLPVHIPDSDSCTLVHGDYRIGNCILHPTEPRIVAILDWELSTTGHPLADLGYAALMYHGANPDAAGMDPSTMPGIPNEEELCAMYIKASGRSSIPHWNFYIIYNMFRLGAIVQGVYKRGLNGNASSSSWKAYHDICAQLALGARQLSKQ